MKGKKMICLAVGALMAGSLLAGCGDSGRDDYVSVDMYDDYDDYDDDYDDYDDDYDDYDDYGNSDIGDGNGYTVTLYYGSEESGGYDEYEADNVDMSTPETAVEDLIWEIGCLTGWNLSLSDVTVFDDGDVYVEFQGDSSVVKGLTEEEYEEFDLGEYGVGNLITLQMFALDSIQKTLRSNLSLYFGYPDDLDLWYSTEEGALDYGGQTVCVEEPWDEKYSW